MTDPEKSRPMWRRCLFAVAVAGLALIAGCGLIQSRSKTPEAPPPGAVARTFDAPLNLVLAAAIDAAGPDFVFDFEEAYFPFWVTSSRGLKTLNDGIVHGKPTLEAEIPIEEMTIGSGSIVGKAKDGRPVTLWLELRDLAQKTEASLRIGKAHEAAQGGDTEMTLAYFNRIADKLAHPKGESTIKFSFDEAVARSLKRIAAPAAKGGPDR